MLTAPKMKLPFLHREPAYQKLLSVTDRQDEHKAFHHLPQNQYGMGGQDAARGAGKDARLLTYMSHLAPTTWIDPFPMLEILRMTPCHCLSKTFSEAS